MYNVESFTVQLIYIYVYMFGSGADRPYADRTFSDQKYLPMF